MHAQRESDKNNDCCDAPESALNSRGRAASESAAHTLRARDASTSRRERALTALRAGRAVFANVSRAVSRCPLQQDEAHPDVQDRSPRIWARRRMSYALRRLRRHLNHANDNNGRARKYALCQPFANLERGSLSLQQ